MTRSWPLRRCLYAVLLLFGLVVLSGCVRRGPHRQTRRAECHPGKKGPPAHAPAHGYRAKCQYRYYPHHQVYYSPRAEVWFWLEGNKWKFGPRLPGPLSVSSRHAVTVELQTPYPYLKHEEVRQKYAPKDEGGEGRGRGKGKGESEGEGKGKGKGEGKGKGKGPPPHARN